MKKVLLFIAINLLLNINGLSSKDILTEDNDFSEGTASWYSERDAGILKTTANRETFDDGKLTCAIWDLPFNTLLKVTNLENGKFVVVRVNDRGPAKRLVKQGRIIDLTREAFSRIADLDKGLIPVKLSILPRR
jgi:rare lipoprotein A